MTKAEAMANWQELTPHQDPLEHMRPIEYKAEGSRYGACGVRIDGSPAFIDAVLSNLKPLLAGENQATRLELARAPVKDAHHVTGKVYGNRDRAAEVCYIRLHMRGHEGAIMAGILDRHLDGATDTFEKVNKYAR